MKLCSSNDCQLISMPKKDIFRMYLINSIVHKNVTTPKVLEIITFAFAQTLTIVKSQSITELTSHMNARYAKLNIFLVYTTRLTSTLLWIVIINAERLCERSSPRHTNSPMPSNSPLTNYRSHSRGGGGRIFVQMNKRAIWVAYNFLPCQLLGNPRQLVKCVFFSFHWWTEK